MTLTDATRQPDDAQGNFSASPELAASLQAVLVDLIELTLQGKQAHWTVVGQNFRGLHLQLDELVEIARAGSDTIAERMRALGVIPDGRTITVSATTSLPAYPHGRQHTTAVVTLVLDSVTAAVATMRAMHDAVDTADPSTSDLLHLLILDLEKQAWMLAAQRDASFL
jgi:starvation-inducible DNA-binding protein